MKKNSTIKRITNIIKEEVLNNFFKEESLKNKKRTILENKKKAIMKELYSLTSEDQQFDDENEVLRKLPNGVIIDTTRTSQTKEEILSMYEMEGYTSNEGGPLTHGSFSEYNRDKDIYIFVGEIENVKDLRHIHNYMDKNTVAVQNFIPKDITAEVIYNL